MQLKKVHCFYTNKFLKGIYQSLSPWSYNKIGYIKCQINDSKYNYPKYNFETLAFRTHRMVCERRFRKL